MLRVIWAYLVRDASMAISYRLNFLMQLAGLFFSIVTVYFMSKIVGPNPAIDRYGGYLPFAIIGFATTSLFTTGFTSFSGAIRNEQLMGTLESVMMTPARLSGIIIASSVWSFLWTMLNSTIMILAAHFFFNVRLHGSITGALLLLFLTTLVFSCFGVVSASFIMIFKRGDPFGYLVTTFAYMLGGVVVPITVLPSWLQKISLLLPITHGLTGLRELILRGAPFSEVLPQLAILLIFAAVGLPLSLFCFRAAVNIARREGSLLHY